MTIQYINPVADCLTPMNPYSLSIESNQPATIALVINNIVDCDVFMGLVGDALRGLHPHLTIKSYPTRQITCADNILMDQIAAECDAAVCAIGHCGSCTAGTVKDGIALVERGIPAVSLITEVFWDQADALARSLGWRDFPRLKLPYPIWGTESGTMGLIANQTADELMPLLERSIADVA